jgi:CopG family nickel-responsive transcriptional regulator
MTSRERFKTDILSFSLSRDLTSKMDGLMQEMGYENRSEVIRDALRVFLEKHEDFHRMQGVVEGVALILYARRAERRVHGLFHKTPDVLRSFLHLDFGKVHQRCCDVVVFKGPAARVREVFHALETTAHVEKVKLTPL